MPSSQLSAFQDTKTTILSRQEAQAVEVWFEKVAANIEAEITKKQVSFSPHLATQFLSRFGLKTPHDVVVFLNSKAGESFRGLVAEVIANHDHLLERIRTETEEKARQHELALLLIGLSYEARAEERQKLNVETQANIDKKLHSPKSTQASSVTELNNAKMSLQLFSMVAEALSRELVARQAALFGLESEWMRLEDMLHTQAKRQLFYEAILSNLDNLYELTTNEMIDFSEEQKELILQLKRDDKIILTDGVNYYLVPRGTTLDELSEAHKENAQKAYESLVPHLKSMHEILTHTHNHTITATNNALRAFVNRAALMHQELVTLTNKLISVNHSINKLKISLEPKLANTHHASPNAPSTNALLTRSYGLLMREAREARIQKDVLFMEPRLRAALQQDIETTNRIGSSIRLPEERTIKPGADPQFSRIDLLSLIKLAESLHMVTAEAGSARQFQLQELRNAPTLNSSPTPTPAPTPKKEDAPEKKYEPETKFNPTPFDLSGPKPRS